MSGEDASFSSSSSSSPNAISSSQNRRGSFTPGQTLTGLFSRSPTKATAGTAAFPSPIATAAANVQSRRRVSISTLGLSGTSPTQTSPFTADASRRGSVSSAGTSGTAIDDSVIEEEGDGLSVTAPTTPLARRMSFGARALRDVRTGAAGTGIGINGEGFNWTDSFRSHAQRAATISVPSAAAAASSTVSSLPSQKSNVAAPPPPPALATLAPPQEMPKAPPKVPDPFQERILKGDFYMD